MKTNSIAIALSLCAALLLAAPASAQRKKTTRTRKPAVRRTVSSGAETSLAGIHLFDTGTRVVSIYGSPDAIEPVTLGGGNAGPGGGAAGGPAGFGLPGGRPGGGGGGGGVGPGSAGLGPGAAGITPGEFQFGDSILDNQAGATIAPAKKRPGVEGTGGGTRSGPMTPGGGNAGGPVMGGGGGAASPTGSGERVLYTRWVYNRNASKYGFIMDRYNHVVQIEAIGIQAGKVRTRRGITFGSSFAQIIKKYGAPDGYEIAGDNVVVRYLSKSKCAFQLNRLGENRPDVVTGIVVAAGKR